MSRRPHRSGVLESAPSSVTSSNREAIQRAQDMWLSREGHSNTTATSSDLMCGILSDRLKGRQELSMEMARKKGARRKQMAAERAAELGQPVADMQEQQPVARRSRRRSATDDTKPSRSRQSTRQRQGARGERGSKAVGCGDAGMDADELQIALALSLSEQAGFAEVPETEAERRAALMTSVNERLGKGETTESEAYARALQEQDDEEATRALIAEISRNERDEVLS